jgi:hypothetical protein
VALEGSARQKEVEQTQTEIATNREQMLRLDRDLGRLREDAKAIGDKGAVAQPLVVRMVVAEDQLGVVRRKIDDLEKEEIKRVGAVRTVLSRLSRS